MKTINKYTINDFRNTYTIPLGSKVLSVTKDPQGNSVIYLEVETTQKVVETRTFWLVHTGRDVPDNSKFLGTFQKDTLMFHVYELFGRNNQKLRRRSDDD